MLNLLKASAKKINPNKRRKVYPLLGSLKAYHQSKGKVGAQSENPMQEFLDNYAK